MLNEYKPKNMMDYRYRMDEKYKFQIVVSAVDSTGYGYPAIIEDVKDFNEAMKFATDYIAQWYFDDKISVIIWGTRRDTNMVEFKLDMTSTAHYKPKPFGMPEGERIVGKYMREV